MARFLGADHAAGGPFALLALSVSELSDDAIIAALDAQLARLAQHRECNTPQADEVRLALHAAAAQLLDPRVRAHLIARWVGQSVAAPVPQERRKFPRASSPHVALEHDAVLTLAMFGGWNQGSLRRIAALSAARGLSPADLAQTLRSLGGGPVAATRPPTPSGPVLSRLATPLPPAAGYISPAATAASTLQVQSTSAVRDDPAERILKIVLLICASVLVLLVVALAVAVIYANRSSPLPAPVPDSQRVAPPIAATAAPPEPAPAPPPVPEKAPDIEAVTRELSAAVAGVAADPEASLIRFGAAIGSLANHWPALAPDQTIAAQHQVIEFVYRAPTPAHALRAVVAIAAGAAPLAAPGPILPDQINSAVWSVAMLTRLAREQDLPAAVEEQIDARLDAALGARRTATDTSFESGAAAALLSIAPRLASAPSAGSQPVAVTLDAWKRWMDAVAAAIRSPAARDRTLLSGLGIVVSEGQDPAADEGTFRVVRLFVSRLTWRPGEQSREWLLKWFDDDRVETADLYAITSALATGSSAEGVDATMVLPILASEAVRAEVRDAYSRAWGMAGSADRAQTIAALFDEAQAALAPDEAVRPLAEVLGSAVVLSRLNEAASWAWKAQTDQTDAVLSRLEQDVVLTTTTPQSRPGLRQFDPEYQRTIREWGQKYLAARRSIPLRLDLMSRLTNDGQIDSLAAELLVADALRGTPAEVRTAAAECVLRFADIPVVVNAVLEELPSVPATLNNIQLIESVGLCRLSGRDPGWRITARRAVVERLLQLVAAEGDLAVIDRQADLLARSYEARILESPPPDASGSAPASPPPVSLSAAYLYRQWKDRIDPALPPAPGLPPPDQIERRRAGRAALARGLVQQFAAEQVAACELMAFIVAAERPSGADRIAEVLSELAAERQSANHIFQQVRATEAAMLRLWLIRLGQGAAS